MGPSYFSRARHARLYGKFYCHFVVTYQERTAPTETCTAVVVLSNLVRRGQNVLNGHLGEVQCS
jgi:hypothetical protein